MMFSLTTAFAEDGDSGHSTTISITNSQSEEYWELTVPASFSLDTGLTEEIYLGYISFSGSFPQNVSYSVFVPDTVTLTNERGSTYNISIRTASFSGTIQGDDTGKASSAGGLYIKPHEDETEFISWGSFAGIIEYTVTRTET